MLKEMQVHHALSRPGLCSQSGSPGSPIRIPIRIPIRKNTARNPAKFGFFRFVTFSVRFGPFLTSWRPGTRLKSFLEAIRFFSTVYEPVATLKTSNRLIFYDFHPRLLVQFSKSQHFSKKSISYLTPAQSTKTKMTANGFSSYEKFVKKATL